VNEQRSALEGALDVLVYAPVGLALTAAEEIPKLAAKGRARVQDQIGVARMVGHFAVAQGRKEIEKRLGGAPPRPPAATAEQQDGTAEQQDGTAEQQGSSGGAPGSPAPARHFSNGNTSVDPRENALDDLPGDSDASVIDVDFGAARPTLDAGLAALRGASIDPAGLAIPGYDSLSASQVVQRLAGLAREELEAVGEYEAAHRARRTILTRVGQLKG